MHSLKEALFGGNNESSSSHQNDALAVSPGSNGNAIPPIGSTLGGQSFTASTPVPHPLPRPVLDSEPSHKMLTPDLAQFFEADPSPTFLVAWNRTEPTSFQLVVANAAFQAIEGLARELHADSNASMRFRSWAQASRNWSDLHHFGGHEWTAFTIQDRWKAVRSLRPATDTAARSTSTTSLAEDIPKLKDEEEKTVGDGTLHLGRLQQSSKTDAKLESLNKMMEMSDVGVFEYHPSGKLIRANEAWYNLSRHPRQLVEHSDFSFMDLVYPPDVPLVMSQWNKLSNKIPVTFEMRWKAPARKPSTEGEEATDFQWILSASVPVLNEKGELESIAGNTIDISAQKRVQQEALRRAEALERARASEQRFTRFADLAPVAIYISNPEKTMQYCNQQFLELTGYTRTQKGDIDWDQIIHPEDSCAIHDAWRELLHDKRPAQAQLRLQRVWDAGDGQIRPVWAQWQSYPECDEQGNIVSICGTLTDIKKFKWVEDIQRTRVEEVLEAKRQQENFIDVTSHEMRNPLSAVIQCADSSIESIGQILKLHADLRPSNIAFVREKAQDELKPCMDALQTIISCSLHQKRIIDDILTLSKLDANLILITPVRVQPVTVVGEALKMFELQCSKEEIQLQFVVDSSLAVAGADWVMMDPSRLLQILINLLTNAIKFSRSRLPKEIKVTLGASPEPLTNPWNGIVFAASRIGPQHILDKVEWGRGDKTYIWITVQDTGCGLTSVEQGRLFHRFSQATPRTHVQYGGSGLGLFISKSLTELQNGSIGVHSEVGVGSTFAFFVGARVAAPSEAERAQQRNTALPKLLRTLSAEEDFRRARYSVLVVEDNLVNQKILSRQLEKAGCDVHVAGHGLEALQFLETTKFWRTQKLAGRELSIVLMDIEMPIMDGLTCTRRIRELEEEGQIEGHLPILAVSANARSEQVRHALEAGVDDSIAKPFRIPEVMAKVELLARRFAR